MAREGNRRVVIVYESAGQAHRGVAELLKSILEEERDVEVVLQDGEGLEGAASGANPAVALWNVLIRRGWLRLADLLINDWLRRLVFPILVVRTGPTVKARLKALGPDAVVTTADIYSRALGDAGEEMGIPFTVFPVEFSVFADQLHPSAHCLCYLDETAQAIRRFDLTSPYFRCAVADAFTWRASCRYLFSWYRAYAFGGMAPSLFQSADDPTPGTNAIPCHTLGLFRRRADHAPVAVRGGPRPRHILVVSGSLGGRFVLNAVRTLVAAPSLDVRVIAVCGRDAAGLEALRALQAWVGPERLECLGYVDDLARRMREADVLLARPSANVFLEAVLAGLPMVVPSRTTLNDMGAVALVRRWGIGETYARHRDMVATLRGLLENLDAYRARVLDARSRRAASPEQAAARIRDVVWRRGAALKSP